MIVDKENEYMENLVFPYVNKFSEYNVNRFKLHLLYHPNVPENEVSQVFIDNTRIGWIFPVSRMESDVAELENENSQAYLIKHMDIALNKLYHQNYQDIKSEKNKNSIDDKVAISSIIGDQAVIFLESLDSSESVEFDFEKTYPLLLLKYNFTEKILNFDAEQLRFKSKTKLNLLSKSLQEEFFIVKVFPELYQKALGNDFLKFSILYQFIEFFIEKILYKSVMREVRQDLNQRKLREKLLSVLSEKDRIKILFTECIELSKDIEDEVTDVYLEFATLLNDDNIVLKDGIHKQIYFIRNTIYHNLRNLSSEAFYERTLKDVNKCFEKIVYELLVNFEEIN